MGNDTLLGGDGQDQLHGGDGRDVFEFALSETGDDTIADFIAAQDILRLDLAGAGSAAVTVTQAGADTQVIYGSNQITLLGVTLTQGEISFELL